MRGYRGLLGELSRTRGTRALWLQVSAGLGHIFRSWARSDAADGDVHFVRHYGPDGFALPSEDARRRAFAAQTCTACGLCSAECARVGGNPVIDPQEGVVATSRLRSEAIRFGVGPLAGTSGSARSAESAKAIAAEGATDAGCGSCRACEDVCPARIPIAEVLDALLEDSSPAG